MTTDMEELVARLVNQLDAEQREQFEERAAIMEFDAGYPRQQAERLALLDLFSNREPLTTVTVIQVELDGRTQWMVTTDPQAARQRLADLGGIETSVRDLITVIDDDCHGVGLLTVAR